MVEGRVAGMVEGRVAAQGAPTISYPFFLAVDDEELACGAKEAQDAFIRLT